MRYQKVELCGLNTAKLPVLKESEKRELMEKAHAGDKEARERMICGNLRLVLSVVQKFSSRGENPDDLFQVGCIGLIKAIDHFDPSLDVRFSTYGVPMIVGEIRRFLRDNNALRVSRSLRDTAYRAMQAREQLEKELGREPSLNEICVRVGLSRREVTAALESVVEPVSLEEKISSVMGYARKHRKFSFRGMLERQAGRIEVVVTFLALLELMKIGKIRLTQDAPFEDMQIETLEPEGEEEEISVDVEEI